MMQRIMDDFFDMSKPCPSEIPLCDKIRAAYNEEIAKVSSSGCSKCAQVNIKSRFIEAIWKEVTSSITSKGS